MSKVDYREILRLDSLHYSRKRISISIGSSHHTVKDVLDTATQKGITWPLDNDVQTRSWKHFFSPTSAKPKASMQNWIMPTSTESWQRPA